MGLILVRQFALDDNDAVGLDDNDVRDTIARALIVFEIKGLIVEKVIAESFEALSDSALVAMSSARVDVLRFWNFYIIATPS